MYRVEVRVVGETSFNGNALRFDTREEAERYAENLACRWLAVQEWRVVEVENDDTAFGHAAWQRSLRDARVDG